MAIITKVLKPEFGFAMQTNRLINSQGFTIVELLIAVFIISIGILAWGITLGGATKNRAISSDITFASELATSQMELLSLRLQSDKPTASPTYGDDNATHQGVTYSLNWTITENSNSLPFWIIDMNITWQRYGSRSVHYQRLVTGG